MRSYTQDMEGEVAFQAHTYTPTFAFALHLKVIQRVCVVGGLPDSGRQPPPPPNQDGGGKGKEWREEGRGR